MAAPKNKCIFVSGSILQGHRGFKVSAKLYLNLCSRKWLKPNRNLVSNLISTSSLILKILFSECLIKFIRAFLKLRQEEELRILGSSLFQSFMTLIYVLSPASKVVLVVTFSFGIKHSYNMITNPIQVKIINPSLTPITIQLLTKQLFG